MIWGYPPYFRRNPHMENHHGSINPSPKIIQTTAGVLPPHFRHSPGLCGRSPCDASLLWGRGQLVGIQGAETLGPQDVPPQWQSCEGWRAVHLSDFGSRRVTESDRGLYLAIRKRQIWQQRVQVTKATTSTTAVWVHSMLQHLFFLHLDLDAVVLESAQTLTMSFLRRGWLVISIKLSSPAMHSFPVGWARAPERCQTLRRTWRRCVETRNSWSQRQ